MWRSPVSVHGWGPCGRRFKSCHPDKFINVELKTLEIIFFINNKLNYNNKK